MHYLPVIDLLDGIVVHAQRGQRDDYRPLVTRLAARPLPRDILDGYLSLYPFKACYIADLNALMARGTADHEIQTLVAQYPTQQFWIDAAFGTRATLPAYAGAANVRCIIGAESLRSLARYHTLRAHLALMQQPVLSLDFRGANFLGPAELLATPALWPQRLIAMNLARVGSAEGPDLALLRALRVAAPTATLAAAGGVRDAADLAALQSLAVSHVLLASALHAGALDAATLHAFATP